MMWVNGACATAPVVLNVRRNQIGNLGKKTHTQICKISTMISTDSAELRLLTLRTLKEPSKLH